MEMKLWTTNVYPERKKIDKQQFVDGYFLEKNLCRMYDKNC